MCVNCDIVSVLFHATSENPIIGSKKVHQLLSEMLSRGRLLVYAADCSFENVAEVLKESQETVCRFYFQCPRCASFFHFSMDKEGKCAYGHVKQIEDEPIDDLIWGKVGSYFQK